MILGLGSAHLRGTCCSIAEGHLATAQQLTGKIKLSLLVSNPAGAIYFTCFSAPQGIASGRQTIQDHLHPPLHWFQRRRRLLLPPHHQTASQFLASALQVARYIASQVQSLCWQPLSSHRGYKCSRATISPRYFGNDQACVCNKTFEDRNGLRWSTLHCRNRSCQLPCQSIDVMRSQSCVPLHSRV